MTDKVFEYVKRKSLIQAGDRIVAGFSGGADSVCLLLVLKKLQEVYDFTFCAVHVEHGIRGAESCRDAEFAKSFCQRKGIPFRLFQVNVPEKARQDGQTLEEAARELRYACFDEACKSWMGNKIAVAHHGDDNAETVLFHMCRGTGIRGMCGILPERDRIIRPLLCVTRHEIEYFLEETGEPFCTDSTNEELAYSRNRIRRLVIPQLDQVNTKAVSHITQMTEVMEEVCEYMDEAAWEAGKDSVWFYYGDSEPVQTYPEQGERPSCVRIEKNSFAGMKPVLQKLFLHQLLGIMSGSRKDLAMIHIDSILQLIHGKTGKMLHLPYGLLAVAEYETVCISQKKGYHGPENDAENIPLEIGGETRLQDGMTIRANIREFCGECEKIPQKSYTKWFDYDKIINTVLVRRRQSSDYLTVTSSGNTKKLKDYLINEKIPRMQRDRIWLLADGSHIMWVLGYRISEAYKVTPQTKRILEVCVDGGEREDE